MGTKSRAAMDRNNAWLREHSAARRQFLAELKVERGCADCGYDAHPAALDFDHVRGEKKFNIAHGVTRKWDKLLQEIEKCDVVCANCHRIRTYNRRD